MAKSKWADVKDNLVLVTDWRRDGLTEEQVAKNLGISVTTMEVYKKEHPEFLKALKAGKAVHIANVKGALAKRALGFTAEERKTYIKEDETGGVTRYTEVSEKYYPPDVAAISFTLKNGDKDPVTGKTKWSDNPAKIDIEHEMLEIRRKLEAERAW